MSNFNQEWARSLILKLATGHSGWSSISEARDFLAGKEPPIKWAPRAVDEYKRSKE